MARATMTAPTLDAGRDRARRLVEAHRDAVAQAEAAQERRDRAIRDLVDSEGISPRHLCRRDGGIGLSEATVYRILGTAP